MTRDEPDAQGLVEIALKTLREVVLPAVPAERRFAALMIANALSIAGRELATGASAEPAQAEAIGGLLGGTGDLETLTRRLCAAIDAGDFDAADRQAALRAVLWDLTRSRLAVSNPKYVQALQGT
ncbi:MAG TPA: DUF6285 domain-containing protein [Azospirillum sp.]